MKFKFHEKSYCPTCNSVTHIKKGLDKQDYRTIITILIGLLVLSSLVALSLYIKIK